MPRRVEDIIPKNGRSIRDVPLSLPTKSSPNKDLSDDAPIGTEKESKINIKKLPISPPLLRKDNKKTKKGKKFLFISLGIVIIIAGGAFVASAYLSRAIFTIIPKEIPVSIDSTYVVSGTEKTDSLSYNVVTVKADADVSVPAKQGPLVQKKAQGTITIYNNYSSSSWRLVAGTRFANASGKVYRIASSVSVPGFTKASDGSKIPGKISAKVSADQAGEDYNLSVDNSLGDLKIVAYKGNEKYDYFYARVSTNISGGYIGNDKIINPEVLSSTTEALKAKLRVILVDKLRQEIAEGRITFDNAYVAIFGDAVIGSGTTDTAKISMNATFYGITFDEKQILNKIAGEATVASFGNGKYEAVDLENISFSISNPNDFSPTKNNTLIMRLKGNIKLIGVVPVDELKQKFAGLSLSETQEILRSYSSVIVLEKSSGQVVPPWVKIPKNVEKISILTK